MERWIVEVEGKEGEDRMRVKRGKEGERKRDRNLQF